MTAMLEEIFEEFGSFLQILRGGEMLPAVKGFVYPAKNSAKEFPFAVTPLGSIDDRHWVCLTQEALREEDRVWFRNECYEAVNCTEICVMGDAAFWRTVLRPEREAAL